MKVTQNGKNTFWAFMCLEKAYDTLDNMADVRSVWSRREIVESGAEVVSGRVSGWNFM